MHLNFGALIREGARPDAPPEFPRAPPLGCIYRSTPGVGCPGPSLGVPGRAWAAAAVWSVLVSSVSVGWCCAVYRMQRGCQAPAVLSCLGCPAVEAAEAAWVLSCPGGGGCLGYLTGCSGCPGLSWEPLWLSWRGCCCLGAGHLFLLPSSAVCLLSVLCSAWYCLVLPASSLSSAVCLCYPCACPLPLLLPGLLSVLCLHPSASRVSALPLLSSRVSACLSWRLSVL